MRHHKISPPPTGVYQLSPVHYGWQCSLCGHQESAYHYYRMDAQEQYDWHLWKHHNPVLGHGT